MALSVSERLALVKEAGEEIIDEEELEALFDALCRRKPNIQLILGAMFPFLFAALKIKAVGRAANRRVTIVVLTGARQQAAPGAPTDEEIPWAEGPAMGSP